MKKNLKKGFTLTELVVVIVIIGILAAVLIPTLTSYITRSRKSAAEQNAVSFLQEFEADVLNADTDLYLEVTKLIAKSEEFYVESGDYLVKFKNGSLVADETVAKKGSGILTSKLCLKTDSATTDFQFEFLTQTTTVGALEWVRVASANKAVTSQVKPAETPAAGD